MNYFLQMRCINKVLRFVWGGWMAMAFVCCPSTSNAQILEFDQNPPNLRWRQIRTPNFDLIYPSSFEGRAQQLGGELEEIAERLGWPTHRPKRTAIILQNQSILSNGFVQLAPRRSEFVTTPSQQGNFVDWLEQLSVHELQHVRQFDRLVGRFRAPFLEQLGLALYGLTLPAWYFEGDAVWTETRWTMGGRGQVPSWSMPFRANLLSGRAFTYQKNYLGSYRDVTPGFYELGYFMVDKMVNDYGEEFPAALLDAVSANLIRPYPFSQALRRKTGYTTRAWHDETVDSLQRQWKQEDLRRKSMSYPVLPAGPTPSRRREKPTDWLLPQPLPDGRIVALRQGMGHTSEIVALDPSGHQSGRPVKIGPQNIPNFSAAGDRLTWDEVRQHPRYAKQTFSVICTYDLLTRKYRQLTRRSRLFSPSLNPEATSLVCVEVDEQNQASLLVLDWDSGRELHRIPVPDPEVILQTPAFSPDGSRVYVVATAKRGTTLLECNLASGQFTALLPWHFQQLERPVARGQAIYFKAHADGVDNIYRLSRTERRIEQLTWARFGAFNPAIDAHRNELIFNNYQVNGQRISRIPLDSIPAQVVSSSDLHAGAEFRLESTQSTVIPGGMGQRSTQDTSLHWTSKPYRDWRNLFNFHSLSVTPGDFSDPSEFQPGIYWLSDNLLNTLQTRLGYVYNSQFRASEYRAGFTYQRFFPVLDVQYSNRGQTGVAVGRRQETTGLFWRENHVDAQVQVPLIFYRRHHIYRFTGSLGTQFTDRYGLVIGRDAGTGTGGEGTESTWIPTDRERSQIEGNFPYQIRFPVRYAVSFSHLMRRSALDLAPRWGQSLYLAYRHTPFGRIAANRARDNQHLAVRGLFYFPGFARHHSTSVHLNYQFGTGVYESANNIPLVHGHDQLAPERIENTLLLNYRFPIAYPDWELGGLAYVKRFKGGFFADFQNIVGTRPLGNQLRTFGMELRSDLNVLRFVLPNVDMGLKLIYINRDEHTQGRFLVRYGLSYSY